MIDVIDHCPFLKQFSSLFLFLILGSSTEIMLVLMSVQYDKNVCFV